MLTLIPLGVMLFMGAFALLRGRISLTTNRVVQGTPARFIGVILLLVLPLSFGGQLLNGVLDTIKVRESPDEDWLLWLQFAAIIGPFVVCALVALIVALMTAKVPAEKVTSLRDQDVGAPSALPT